MRPAAQCKSCRMADRRSAPRSALVLSAAAPQGRVERRLGGRPRRTWPRRSPSAWRTAGSTRRPAATRASSSRRSTRSCRRRRMSPAMGRRKVFVVGDADRMVAQEGNRSGGQRVPQAARGAAGRHDDHPHLERVRARCCRPFGRASFRFASRRSPTDDVRAFLAELRRREPTRRVRCGPTSDDLVQLAGGAPGPPDRPRGLGGGARPGPSYARRGDAPDRGTRMRVALSQGGVGARGKFSDMLDALTVLLHERSRSAAKRGQRARGQRRRPRHRRGRGGQGDGVRQREPAARRRVAPSTNRRCSCHDATSSRTSPSRARRRWSTSRTSRRRAASPGHRVHPNAAGNARRDRERRDQEGGRARGRAHCRRHGRQTNGRSDPALPSAAAHRRPGGADARLLRCPACAPRRR